MKRKCESTIRNILCTILSKEVFETNKKHPQQKFKKNYNLIYDQFIGFCFKN